MDILKVMAKAQDAATVKRVYGEPYERDGVVLIPAAEIRGGGGGGGGTDADTKSTGSGGGYGVEARPVGAFAIEDGRVRWVPAVDVMKIVTRGLLAVLGITFFMRFIFRWG